MSDNKRNSTLGKLLLLAVTIAWGSSFIILKDTLSSLGNGNFTFFVLACRFVVSGLVLAVVFWKKIKTISKSALIKGLILGVILFFAYGIQTIGLKFTSPSKNAFLTTVYIVLVPFFSWFMLKKKPEARNYFATILCFVGIAFVALIGKNDHGSSEFLGDILTIASGVFYALQIVYISKCVEKEDAMHLLVVEIITVAVLCCVFSGAFEFSMHASEFAINFDVVWRLLYLALVCTLFAQFGQIVAQKFVSPVSIALIFSLESVFGVIFELLFGEINLTPYIIIGFACIFISQLVSEISIKDLKQVLSRRKKQAESSENQEKIEENKN